MQQPWRVTAGAAISLPAEGQPPHSTIRPEADRAGGKTLRVRRGGPEGHLRLGGASGAAPHGICTPDETKTFPAAYIQAIHMECSWFKPRDRSPSGLNPIADFCGITGPHNMHTLETGQCRT